MESDYSKFSNGAERLLKREAIVVIQISQMQGSQNSLTPNGLIVSFAP
jgi:hypothetical protein